MKNWTTQAERRLTDYLEERSARGFDGEDTVELRDDWRRHIHEEAEQAPGEVIGLMQLENILGKLDAGYQPVAATPGEVRKKGWFGGFLCWVFGVVLPLAVLIFEMVSAFCGVVFFDPVPTWWHAGWIALVPAVNGWLLRGGRGVGDKARGVAAGFVLVTAVFYGLLFLPLLPASVIALIFFGLGLLSLTPVLTAIAAWRIGRRVKRDAAQPGKFRTGWRMGVLASLLVMTALEGPGLWTRLNLSAALADGKGSAAAVGRLRIFHSERVLLKACYEGNRGTSMATDISGWITQSWRIPLMMIYQGDWQAADSQKVRDVFFRVTGRPFNTLPPPKTARGSVALGKRGDPLEEFEFDDHRGGDQVAVRLKNLDLAQSRFDGHVDGASRIGYGEWTMVFRNTSRQQKEARCQVKLPRDGRVSRLTLWVNGEPREAAFSTVSKVKAAYKAVAIVQRRDPVLVNMVGPDTVMVQCFPVPAHGEMKIRLGVTAPLDGLRWELPRIVECNFGLADELEHALWLQGDCAFGLTGTGKDLTDDKDGGGHSLPVTLDGASVMNSGIALCAGDLPAETGMVWCEDRFAKPSERILIREASTVTRPPAPPPVVVIDGSQSLAGAKDWITKALGNATECGLSLVLADDRARRVTVAELEGYRFSGGRDNEPALREAIRLARESGGPIIWIHGPQAVGLSQSEALLQLLERGMVRPVIHEVEAVAGPNRLAEAIYRTGCLHRGPGLSQPAEDLARFLIDMRGERRDNVWKWRRAASADHLPGNKVWDQLARSWAAAAAEDPDAELTESARSELAARYQLVTPLSGAVVLETQAQYDQHGLTPADGDTTPQIPVVPEPSTGLLVMLAGAAAMLRRRRSGESLKPSSATQLP